MKTFIFMVAILCLLSGCAWAEDVDISAIVQIESNGNPNAYNKSSGAIGLMQITPICLKEFNQIEGKQTFMLPFGKANTSNQTERFLKISDLYNPVINEYIGTWYINKRIPQMLKAYHIEDTIRNRLIAYNWGIGNLKKYRENNYGTKQLPKETQNYIKKYHKLTKER